MSLSATTLQKDTKLCFIIEVNDFIGLWHTLMFKN
jgi:hypothetical protein